MIVSMSGLVYKPIRVVPRKFNASSLKRAGVFLFPDLPPFPMIIHLIFYISKEDTHVIS